MAAVVVMSRLCAAWVLVISSAKPHHIVVRDRSMMLQFEAASCCALFVLVVERNISPR